MDWCDEPTSRAKNYDFCEGELIFQFTYSYILFYTTLFINLDNDLLF